MITIKHFFIYEVSLSYLQVLPSDVTPLVSKLPVEKYQTHVVLHSSIVLVIQYVKDF